KAVAAEAQANAESDKAKRSEAEARAVLSFFSQQVLAAARPKDFRGGLGGDATIRNALDAAEPKIAAAFREQPLVEASIRFELGNSYRLLGTMKPALLQFRRTLEIRQAHLGPDHEDTLLALFLVASVSAELGAFDRAIPLLEQFVAAQTARYGRDTPSAMTAQNNLAIAYHRNGQYHKAVALFEPIVDDLQGKPGFDPLLLFIPSNLG